MITNLTMMKSNRRGNKLMIGMRKSGNRHATQTYTGKSDTAKGIQSGIFQKQIWELVVAFTIFESWDFGRSWIVCCCLDRRFLSGYAWPGFYFIQEFSDRMTILSIVNIQPNNLRQKLKTTKSILHRSNFCNAAIRKSTSATNQVGPTSGPSQMIRAVQ